jgi:hypothetical protein
VHSNASAISCTPVRAGVLQVEPLPLTGASTSKRTRVTAAWPRYLALFACENAQTVVTAP